MDNGSQCGYYSYNKCGTFHDVAAGEDNYNDANDLTDLWWGSVGMKIRQDIIQVNYLGIYCKLITD